MILSRQTGGIFLKATWIALGLGTLAACTHYRPQPLVPETTAAALSARSLTDDGLHRFLVENLRKPLPAWPLPQWNLEQLTLAAYYYQPSLDVARAEWGVATAGTVTAGQRPNPSISLSGTYDTTAPPPWIPAVSLDVPIQTGGKRGLRLTQARQLADAARWKILTEVWQVRSTVRSALLDLYNARQTDRLLTQQETAQAEVVRLLEGQLDAGAVGATTVTQARIALDTTRLSREQAHRQHAEAQAALAEAIGVPTTALQEVTLSFDGLDRFPPTIIAAEVRRQAILNRADIRSALANYAASQSALQLEIANQYPDIHLGPGYEFDQTDNKWTLGISLTLPILNQNQGPIAEARARRHLAAAQFIAVQARASGEIDQALAGYQAARQQAAVADNLQRNLQRQLDSVRARRQAGELSALDIANAQVEYVNGALLHLDALVKAQQALGRLEDAVQSPLIVPAAVLHHAAGNPRATIASPGRESERTPSRR